MIHCDFYICVYSCAEIAMLLRYLKRFATCEAIYGEIAISLAFHEIWLEFWRKCAVSVFLIPRILPSIARCALGRVIEVQCYVRVSRKWNIQPRGIIRKGSAYITETIRSVVVWPFENSKVYDKVSVIKHRKSGVNKLKGYSTSAKLLTYHLSAATEVVEALNFCFSKIVTVQCMSLFLWNNRPVCFLFVIANCIYYSISQNLAQSSTHTALACTPSRTKFLCGIIRASSRYLTVR